jgi:hypothetical protein
MRDKPVEVLSDCDGNGLAGFVVLPSQGSCASLQEITAVDNSNRLQVTPIYPN